MICVCLYGDVVCVSVINDLCAHQRFCTLCVHVVFMYDGMIPINFCAGGGPRAAHGNHCRPAHQARQQLLRAQGGHQQRTLHQGQGRQGQSGCLNRSRIAWIGSDQVGLDRIGSDRMGSDRMGSDRIGSDRIGSDRIGSDRIGSDRIGSDRIGSDRIRSERFESQ